MSQSRKTLLTVGALFAVAVLMRAPGLGFHSLWFDETSTANVVHQPGYSLLYQTLYTFEGTPPFFYAIEKVFIDTTRLPVTEITLRFLPMLFGAASCVVCFFLFRRLGSARSALLGFSLVAASSFHIYLSEEARCYTLLGFASLLTLLLAIRWWEKPDSPRSATLFIVTVCAVQTHYYAALWILAIICAVFMTKRKDRLLGRFVVLVGAATALAFLPLIPLFLNQVRHEVGPIRADLTACWAPGLFYAPVKVLIGSFLYKISRMHDITLSALSGIIPMLAVLAVTAVLLVRRWRTRPISDAEKIVTLSVACAFVLHGILGHNAPTIHPRYMAHFLIVLFGLIMIAVEDRKTAQVLLCSMILAYNIVGLHNFYNKTNAYIEPWKEIAREVDSLISERGGECKAVIADPMICHPLAFYSPDTTLPVYAVPLSPASLDYVHLSLFGHDALIPLYPGERPTKYFPIAKPTTFVDIARSRKCGIVVSKDRSSLEMMDRLRRDYGAQLDLQLVKVRQTNQGEVSIVRWALREVR